jgi:NAD(P)-dependent dehydrogenase (short-subunit alcohol dehydrogenase family)
MALCVVTGSASGMGAATAHRLRGQGHTVIGVDLLAGDVRADLSNAQGRRSAIDQLLQRTEGRMDRLVCCAGLGPSAPAEAVASVNYFGTVQLLDALLPALRKGEAPSAVVIGSNEAALWNWDKDPLPHAYLHDSEAAVHALLGLQRPADRASHVAYASSKHAVTVAVRSRAAAWGAAGVRLNVVAPGPVQTPLLQACEDDPRFSDAVKAFVPPLGRRAQPDEVAGCIEFLLGAAASYVHGSVLFVDGGIAAVQKPERY